MAFDPREQRKQAQQFAHDWMDRGYEKGETAQFWGDLLYRVLGIKDSYELIKYEIRAANGGFIDALIPDRGVLIEQKASDVDLDKPELRQGIFKTPFEQARDYAEGFPRVSQPRYLVTCNFKTFRVYDRDKWNREELASHYLDFSLKELSENPSYLGFIADVGNSRTAKERAASIKAGELIGELYDEFKTHYDLNDPADLHSLNVLCVRLVFCLFAEDAMLFPKDSLYNYLHDVPPDQMGMAIDRLFVTLDTPKSQRNKFDTATAWAPYVNGGLFAERVPVPPFDVYLKNKLLIDLSENTDWSSISPTIFGGIFESTLNPETRRQGGMHYTSPENIHKLIDPLFLNDLKTELRGIIESDSVPRTKKTKLERFHDKISNLDFLDPACGSGNFLTETYLCLRNLENDCLNALMSIDRKMAGGQMVMIYDVTESSKHVSLDQFHGIEINDFACRVAKTALWIAKLQADGDGMALELEEPFPLHEAANIVCGNALRMDWNDVVAAERCDYIIGNPPFKGAHASEMPRTPEQTADLIRSFENQKGAAEADYVAAWFALTASFTKGKSISASFVTTNSIGQGQQPSLIWPYLWDKGVRAFFAYQPFLWGNEASDNAAVAVTIIGLTTREKVEKTYYETDYRTGEVLGSRTVENISPYLKPGTDSFVGDRSKPICNVAEMGIGNKPIDGGNYIFKDRAELDSFVKEEPAAEPYIHEFLGSREFINGKKRWILWLGDLDNESLSKLPKCQERIEAVRQYRLSSNSKPTQKLADTPTRYHVENMPHSLYIVVPEVSSERRHYIPIGLLTPDVLCSNKLKIVPDASLYSFGVLQSQFHNAWMRTVAGRMKQDYSYSSGVVYNNFIWPSPTPEQQTDIEIDAQEILNVRESYPDKSLADLYDPDRMPNDLLQAHKALDRAVEAAYGVDFDGDEEKIVAHLFKLYAEATSAS